LNEAEQELDALEQTNQDAIDAYEASEKAAKSAAGEVEKYELACRDAGAKVEELSGKETDNILIEQKEAYADLIKSVKELGISLSDLGVTEEYSGENAEKIKQALLKLNKEKLEAIRLDNK
jgi:hypothetical protein